MRFVAPQFTMNAGIYSPELAEREDTEAYYASVRDMLNMRPKAEGGADLRPGFGFDGFLRGTVSVIDLDAVDFTTGAGVTLGEDGGEIDDPGGGTEDPDPYPGGPNYSDPVYGGDGVFYP